MLGQVTFDDLTFDDGHHGYVANMDSDGEEIVEKMDQFQLV